MQFLSLISNFPLSFPQFCAINKPRGVVCQLLFNGGFKDRRSGFSSSRIRVVEKDSQQFEIDREKAREALQNLDQQLQSLSQKKPSSPSKIKAPDINFTRDQMTEEMPEFTESFFAYSAIALVIFTIFYNVLFYTVIQPAIDGPEPESTTSVQTNYPKAAVQ